MTDRLKKSIEVLQYAYLNEELRAGDCEACAVGNLVAASTYKRPSYDWRFVFCTDTGVQKFYQPILLEDDSSSINYKNGLKAIEATGYSIEELARIEYIFETSLSKDDERLMPEHESQWIRLQAVLKVLFDIEGIDYDQEIEQPFLEKALL